MAAHPQRVVARCLEAAYDYAGLNLAANRLGHALILAGVKVDQPVALLAERGLPLLGMIVGSFKAGAGYLPLDPGRQRRACKASSSSAARRCWCAAPLVPSKGGNC